MGSRSLCMEGMPFLESARRTVRKLRNYNKMTSNFHSNGAIPPGTLVKDAIEDGLTTREAIRDALGLNASDFESFLGGGIALTETMAETIAAKFGGSARFWLDFDARHKADSQKS